MLRKKEQTGIISKKEGYHALAAQNIKNGNCFKTIFIDKDKNHNDNITHLFARAVNENEAFAITMDFSRDYGQTIKCWNLNTGLCKWTFQPKDKTFYRYPLNSGKLQLTRDLLIYYGGRYQVGNKDFNEDMAHVIDLESGKPVPMDLYTSSKIWSLGNSIFQSATEHGIQKTNLETGEITFHDFDQPLNPSNWQISDSKRYMLNYGNKTNLYVYDSVLDEIKEFDLSRLDPLIDSIACSYFSDPYFYCGIRVYDSESSIYPTFCKIDPEKGEINLYRYIFDNGVPLILSIIVENNTVYIGDCTNIIFAVNLLTGENKVLGKHDNPPLGDSIKFPGLKNGILVSGLCGIFNSYSRLNFWDTETMELLKTMKNRANNVCIIGERVLITKGNKLVQRDYRCNHEGKIFTENSFQKQ